MDGFMDERVHKHPQTQQVSPSYLEVGFRGAQGTRRAGNADREAPPRAAPAHPGLIRRNARGMRPACAPPLTPLPAAPPPLSPLWRPQLWAVVSGQARMDLGPPCRRDPRVPPSRRDVSLQEFAQWGSDCGTMFFFPEGALNILYSPSDKNFSVKIKYMGFAPDGYCKRINACSRAGASLQFSGRCTPDQPVARHDGSMP
jgi:hypothetical protein